ncbi:hypothetical protein [Paraburkholderia tropica]|uniref:hypothetical protein n=1 Tax=Paraburkholderia tropica TaxID=92647 RepID=UPI001CC40292|nr:hypothetical protein [Paraburkholderia tropica]
MSQIHDCVLRSTANRAAALQPQIWLQQFRLRAFDLNPLEMLAIRGYVFWNRFVGIARGLSSTRRASHTPNPPPLWIE